METGPGRPSPPLPLQIQASEKPKSVLASPLASSRLQEPFARYFFFPPFPSSLPFLSIPFEVSCLTGTIIHLLSFFP
ncbi:hypothetical protein BO79DRAFT_39500 [Aspergillus costaricaensis CBS 115574]|uniref:Uncharacterized protein n=1 Tax=Aspergillus costaricaensis CBS 115574 TaxID=1448317 RepID=A0ACD1I8W1_9EURO|nr:hypothetical protein BO79DRAFT_39500 [Aspergillus costaricaensis CBS 115574]RAK86210.1 hypothetical protein BO79DRAFT_39500 [Aspergillus costaricaensis CBS 115574]